MNILVSPMVDDVDKKKDEIYILGIPINLANILSYNYFLKDKEIIFPYKEIIYKLSFQTFFNSMLFDNLTPVIIDGLMVLISVLGNKKLNENK